MPESEVMAYSRDATSRPKRVALPNGCYVYEDTPNSAEILYRQVLGYFEHGLKLKAGMTVFDVGANVGMFALESLVQTNGQLRIFCFEPAPTPFASLRRSLDEQFPNSKVEALNVGLSSAVDEATLFYRPHASAMSSFESECVLTDEDVRRLASMAATGDLPPEYASKIPFWFAWLPRTIRARLIQRKYRRLVSSVVPIACKLTTIAQIIREYDVGQIDVLKIDVEGSEWDVLQGIGSDDWPKIQSVAIEIHNVNGRLRDVERLLEKQRFAEIRVYQEDVFRGTTVYGIWGTRNDACVENDVDR